MEKLSGWRVEWVIMVYIYHPVFRTFNHQKLTISRKSNTGHRNFDSTSKFRVVLKGRNAWVEVETSSDRHRNIDICWSKYFTPWSCLDIFFNNYTMVGDGIMMMTLLIPIGQSSLSSDLIVWCVDNTHIFSHHRCLSLHGAFEEDCNGDTAIGHWVKLQMFFGCESSHNKS